MGKVVKVLEFVRLRKDDFLLDVRLRLCYRKKVLVSSFYRMGTRCIGLLVIEKGRKVSVENSSY